MIFFIFLLISLVPTWAAAEACPELDLSRLPEAPMTIIPRWSQGHSHLCYAFAVASLIDHYRLTRGDKDRSHFTSPLLLSLKTAVQFHNLGSTLKGGRVEHAFAAAKKGGSCGARLISDKLGFSSVDQILETFEKAALDFLRNPEQKTEIAEQLRLFLRISPVKDQDLPTVSEIEKYLSSDSLTLLAHSLTSFCGETKNLENLPSPNLLFQPDASVEEITEKIQNILGTQTPVGINYCANIVTDPEHRGFLKDQRWICEKNKNHSAIIVGRKTINDRCHFLIRDTGCEGYKNNSDRCQQGQYWIDARLLSRNLHGIFWLE